MTISIVLYGRNDSYGYNLHKRAALSLNCMAEVLTDPSDEILFVDYNTPDDFPTFPEAIQDTLTKRARDILRIFRVRPWVHQRFTPNTHLVALEPIARNVAVRRSCPDNRWILSTNTDMIFVPRGADSLSTIAQRLAPGFYHAPRIEIPEVLWEGLDRHAPAGVITTVRDWGSTLHLNEIILGAEFILYDGPGDFQLLLRDDLFENHGFHEEMLLGWHVDSNIAKRMYLKYGTVGDLGPEVYGYHCDHTRQVTPAHSHARLQNDWRRFCDQVDSPDVPEQASTWGCANDTIEEVRLVSNPSGVYVQALREAIGGPLIEPQVTKYTLETYNRTDYDPRHMVPFLADMFASMPRSSDLAWFGAGPEMLRRFATVWARLGFTGRIFVDPEVVRGNDLNDVSSVDRTSKAFNSADAFVFDFGGLPGAGASRDPAPYQQVSKQLLQRFLEVVREERSRLSTGLPPRRVIALNAINNQFERLIAGYVAAAATPCATHMRHGFVLPAKEKDDWLPLLQIGPAGVRVGSRIKSDPHKLGVIAHGPYKYLDVGHYRLSLKAELLSDQSACTGKDPCIAIIVHAGAKVFGSYALCRSALLKPNHEFVFFVPNTAADTIDGIETRIILLSRVAVSIEAATIESLAMNSNEIAPTHSIFSPPVVSKIDDWLPYLSLGALGRSDDGGIYAQKGHSDFVVFGPYWPLPAGHYEMVIAIESTNESQPGKHLVRADVVSGEEWLSGANFYLDALPSYAGSPIRVPFRIDGNTSECRLIETRLWSSGEERFWIRSLSVKPQEQSRRRDFLPFLLLGEIGRRLGNHVSNVDGGSGLIAYSPTMRVKSGGYRIDLAVEFGSSERAHRSSPGYALMLVKHGYEVLGVSEITADDGQTKEQALVFEVPANQGPDSGLELSFLVVGNARVTLRELILETIEGTLDRGIPPVLGLRNALTVEKNSDAIEPRALPAVWELRNWLPFLRIGPAGLRVDRDVTASQGQNGYVVYGPYWPLPAGEYVMELAVELEEPAAGSNRNKLDGTFASLRTLIRGRHANTTFDGGADIMFDGRQIAVVEGFTIGSLFSQSALVRLTFKIPVNGANPWSLVETRVWSTGARSFRIRSLALERLTPNDKT